MKTFDLQIPTDTVRVEGGQETGVTFTVTNRSDQSLRGLVRLMPEGACRQEWLSVEGRSTIEFEAGASQQVEIAVSPPQGAPPGTHKFKLIVASEDNPDEDYVEGVVQFDVAESQPVPEKKARWPLFAAIAAGVVVLIVLAIVLVKVLGGGGGEPFPVPKLAERPRSEAETLLEALRLKGEFEEEQNMQKPPGEVLRQDPPPDTQVSKGDVIKLWVATRPDIQQVDVPPVEGKSLEFAKGALETRGFRVHAVLQTRKRAEHVSGFTAGELEAIGPKRRLVAETAEKTRKIEGAKEMPTSMMYRIRDFEALSVAAVRQIQGKVVKQNPGPNEKAPEGSVVTVTIHQED